MSQHGDQKAYTMNKVDSIQTCRGIRDVDLSKDEIWGIHS
jgi:hypothetical protein